MRGRTQSQLERQGMGPYDRQLETSFSWIHFCAADPIPELKRTKLSGLLVLSHMWVLQVTLRYQSTMRKGRKGTAGRGERRDEHQMRVNSSR